MAKFVDPYSAVKHEEKNIPVYGIFLVDFLPEWAVIF